MAVVCTRKDRVAHALTSRVYASPLTEMHEVWTAETQRQTYLATPVSWLEHAIRKPRILPLGKRSSSRCLAKSLLMDCLKRRFFEYSSAATLII